MTHQPWSWPPIRPTRDLSAVEFWNVYYSGKVTRLTRSDNEYTGEFDVYHEDRFIPDRQPFRVGRWILAAYSYNDDPRFFGRIHENINDSLAAVTESAPMHAETLPNSRQLKLVATLAGFGDRPLESLSYSELREQLVETLRDHPIGLAEVLRAAKAHPEPDDYQLYKERHDASNLRTERNILISAFGVQIADREIQDALIEIVEHPFVDVDTARLAIWALGRQNDKRAILHLIQWLSAERYAIYGMSIEKALQAICSGPEMLPLGYEDEGPHWQMMVAGSCPSSSEDWIVWDAGSVFWEKRLRIATENRTNLMVQDLLGKDEVAPVATAAASTSP